MSLPSAPNHNDLGTLNGNEYQFDSDLNAWLLKRTASDKVIQDNLDSDVLHLRSFFYQGAQSSGYPVGCVVAFAVSNLPEGFILADGSTFNQTLYPDLYEYLGNSNILPDYTNRTLSYKIFDYGAVSDSDNNYGSDTTDYSEVYFGIAAYNGAGFISDSELIQSVLQLQLADRDSDISALQSRVTELEGDLTQAIADRVYTDNQLSARLDAHDSDIALRGRFYVQATAPSGGPNSGWVNTNNMRLHIWSEEASAWTEVVTT